MASAALLLTPTFFSRDSTPPHFSLSPRSHRSPPSPPLLKSLTEIESSGVIACLRASSGELAMEAAVAALRGGISVLEIVMSTPGVFEVIEILVREHPTSVIGVGTILNSKDARNAVEAGAKFLMSPATVEEILDEVEGTEILYIPGVTTPTEVLNAYNAGANMVKVYPVSALGGPQYISAIKKPFSHIPMVASQGITIGLLHEDQSFIYGVTVGLGLLLIYNRNEYNKMVELRAQMEILQKDIRNEVYNKYVVFDSPKEDKSLSCSTSDSNEVCDQFFKIDSTSESAECRGIAQLEAEPEAELELLQLNLQVKILEDLGQRCLQPIQNAALMGNLGGSFSRECNTQEPRNSKAYGVCPYKLERRLHELLEIRQQEQIAELESALERAENELHEKEVEICWWKENRHELSQNKPQVMRFLSMNR